MMNTFRLQLGSTGYPIYVLSNELKILGSTIKPAFRKDPKIVVVTQPNIANLYFDPLYNSLKEFFPIINKIEILDGEIYKNHDTVLTMIDQLINFNADRSTVLLALGGGVVGDVTGFVASIYMRGIAYVQVPTTLLSQVDSSIGGKTGINHHKTKNLVGSFYQPKAVFVDIQFLQTLPEKEYLSGMAEIIKSAVIGDAHLCDYLIENKKDILNKKENPLLQIVQRACLVKKRIVELDEKENNLRATLNFGHTIGHALESITNYNTYSHGEAISIGMAMAARYSLRKKLCKESVVKKIILLLQTFGLPTELPEVEIQQMKELISHDKKMMGSEIGYVAIKDLGQVQVTKVLVDELFVNG